DSFGHDQADALLIDVGQRLTDAVRQSDLVARMGADEFAIVLGQSQGHLNAQIVAQRLFRGPVTLTSGDGRSLTVTAAVGGVIATGGMTHTVADLYRKASLALSSIKDKGGTRVAFFHPESHARDLFQLDLEPQIMRGIRDQEFSLYHQPLVSLRDGRDGRANRIEGFEALIRWQHPTLGMVSPGTFVPMLESSGLIEPLGRWIVGRACADLLRLQNSPGGADLFLNLNVSHRQLRAPDFAQLVASEVRASGVDPSKLGIELTETTMIDDFEVVTANIDALRKTGIKIFVDDFGVGYSSLSSLSRLPVDVLKIDRSFIREMTVHPRSAALVAKIVEIGHIFDLPIVAEG
ncbi:MAG TPA: bifunctional diguanylate cyclase/phosphodiesterase, partial [Myxococcota bacterium]|nr:bifunctional diguanylate cyclase/phosphodiesterase [Myxococcota bacterium]